MKPADLQILNQSKLEVPPRSRLFNLPPIGLGTPLVECLASYIHRLAAAHGLPTWVLVCRELSTRYERKSITGENGYCDLFGPVGMTINGDNDTAVETINILQSLTGQPDLYYMTFCRLGNLVGAHRILRRTQSWCPECLNQWRQEDQPIYQPLIWLVSQLRTCPIHGHRLQDRCPECGKMHTPLTRYRWTGHCPRCFTWLGNTPLDDAVTQHKLQSEWNNFCAGALGRLIVALQLLPEHTPRTLFPDNVERLVEKHFAGNRSALARTLRVQGFTARCWAHGTQRPSFASLLALAYCFGGEMLEWLAGRMYFSEPNDFRTMDQAVAERIRRPLRIVSRQTAHTRLALAAQATESPPPSFRVVCRRIEMNQTTAKSNFPELAAAITGRYQKFQADSKHLRAVAHRTAVEAAIQKLRAQQLTFSFKNLRKVLPPGTSTRDKRLREEFRRQQDWF